MKDLVTGLKSFRSNGQHHHDVQPANIFVLDNKTFKLVDSCFVNEEKTGFDRKYQEFDYYTPLAPQALGSLFMRDTKATYDKEKNDIWGLGNFKTLLQLLT